MLAPAPDAALPLPGAAAAAREAGLVFGDDARPGLTRRRSGRGFAYRDARGARLSDKAALARIRALAIPPAWTQVWIAPSPRAHLQATGRDARGRKQYLYHADWRALRESEKFAALTGFAAVLPKLRRAAETDMGARALTREKIMGLIVTLLQATLIRIGNRSYARDNESYGLTTLTCDHVDVNGGTLRFHFRGKSGKEWRLKLRDARIARTVKRLQELPGQSLFAYRDEDGALREVESQDVNDYIRAITQADFTAKTIRTWAGTVIAARDLARAPRTETATARRKQISAAIKRVAARLGNTPAVCRASYVHPAIVAAFEDGALHAAFSGGVGDHDDWMEDERRVKRLLERMTQSAERAAA